MKRRILITGGTGFVGQNLCRDLAERFEVFATFRKGSRVSLIDSRARAVPFDGVNGACEELLRRAEPDVVVHCLAMARAAPCHENPRLAHRVNVGWTASLARAAREKGMRFLFTSTDQVFDGTKGSYTEDDPPSPRCVYAKTKVEAENRLAEIFRGEERLLTVFRLALSYGWSDESHPGPAGWILQNLRKGKSAHLFRDEFRSPLFVGDISRAVADSVEGEISGLYHLAGPDRIDRYTFGIRLAERFGLDTSLCVAASVVDHPGPEPRSPDCSMSNHRFGSVFGWCPRDIEEGLKTMAATRNERGRV